MSDLLEKALACAYRVYDRPGGINSEDVIQG